jgi:hypothetical protein
MVILRVLLNSKSLLLGPEVRYGRASLVARFLEGVGAMLLHSYGAIIYGLSCCSLHMAVAARFI